MAFGDRRPLNGCVPRFASVRGNYYISAFFVVGWVYNVRAGADLSHIPALCEGTGIFSNYYYIFSDIDPC